MKKIDSLTNVEKAKILYGLFPNEIPAFLDFVQAMCTTIQEEQELQRIKWDNGIFSFNFWLSLVIDAERRMKQYGKRLYSNNRLFAEQLFDGYLAMYMVHCLTVYTTIKIHPNPKFTKAIDLFFNA